VLTTKTSFRQVIKNKHEYKLFIWVRIYKTFLCLCFY